VFKISAAFVVAVLAGSAFASTAEAGHGGSFYASPFFRNQGRQPSVDYDSSIGRRDRDAEFARARARAREREAAREAAAEAAAAREAAAAKRARLIALQRQEAAKIAAAQATAAADTAPALKKGDELPISAATTTATVQSAAAVTETTTSVSETPASTAPETCRKYSAAIAGLVDTPCQ
jgi:hypothetical protein